MAFYGVDPEWAPVTGRLGGERDLDGRSDLYALGGVLSEMLAGQPPFTGFTVESVIHEHLTASPAVITSIRLGTPPVQGPWIFHRTIVASCIVTQIYWGP